MTITTITLDGQTYVPLEDYQRREVLIGELAAALMSASDALDHTDYLLGDSYSQVNGVKGAIKRGYDVLEKAERAMK